VHFSRATGRAVTRTLRSRLPPTNPIWDAAYHRPDDSAVPPLTVPASLDICSAATLSCTLSAGLPYAACSCLLRHACLWATTCRRSVTRRRLRRIALESLIGVGIELSKRFEIRVVRHSVTWLGRYRGDLGPADLGTTGPYGVYATVGVRWKFGGWGRE